VLLQLELPDAVIEEAARRTTGFLAINVAPPRPLSAALIERADLIVANEHEFAAIPGLDRAGVVAVTFGAAGAALLRDGVEVARAAPPPVVAVDGTAAGDAFCAALLVALLAGRDDGAALAWACSAGAAAATRHGAQPSLPTAAEVDALLDRARREGAAPGVARPSD
jgi:ribokinase